MISTRAAAAVAAAALGLAVHAAAPAAADALPRLVFCDDFASVDAAQLSFCIEDAQGAVLGGGVTPSTEVLPSVVADPAAPGGWRLAIPEGWAGTAVMNTPALVATPPPAAPSAPAPAPAAPAPVAEAPAAPPAPASAPAAEPAAAPSPAPAGEAPPTEPEATALAAAAPANVAADLGAQGGGPAGWAVAMMAALAAGAAAAVGLRRRRAGQTKSVGPPSGPIGEMGGAEGI